MDYYSDFVKVQELSVSLTDHHSVSEGTIQQARNPKCSRFRWWPTTNKPRMQDIYRRVGVQTCNKDPWLALLEYRNTLVETIDPAQCRDSCLKERRCSWKTRGRRLVVKSFVTTGSFSNHRNSQQQKLVWKLHTKLPSLLEYLFLQCLSKRKLARMYRILHLIP